MIQTTTAQGRLQGREPVAVIDIGSNSVRLVVYEGLVRSPTVLFNEKIMCGLGRGLAKIGRLTDEAMEMALRTLRRFHALNRQLQVQQVYTLATAAVRDAKNGAGFVARAKKIMQGDVHLLSGKQEAACSAFGVVSAFYQPDGMVGDLGGGSLELVNLVKMQVDEGISLPLGGLRLMEASDSNLKQARRMIREQLQQANFLAKGRGRPFFAVGGTWRNLAKLHMNIRHYPLPIMQAYEIRAEEAVSFLHRFAKGDVEHMRGITAIAKGRRELLPYGAAAMLELVEHMQPEKIVFSGAGMREGYLYQLLPDELREQDPLLSAAEEMAVLRARSPRHAHELIDWTQQAFAVLGVSEKGEQKRYREASCLLADIGWRIDLDYRGIQAANQIAYGVYPGINHQGRVFAALAIFFRNEGLVADHEAPDFIRCATPEIVTRARLLGAVMRISSLFCASDAGVLPQMQWRKTADGVELQIPARYADLIADRPEGRLRQLAKLSGIAMHYRVMP